MLGRKAPQAAVVWEAKADGVNDLGEPFSANGLSFPSGEWIEVPAGLVERLRYVSWAELRQKAGD